MASITTTSTSADTPDAAAAARHAVPGTLNQAAPDTASRVVPDTASRVVPDTASRAVPYAAKVARRSAAVALLAAVWEVLPRAGVFDRTFLPPLSEVLLALGDLAASGELLDHARASLGRSLAGFGLAIVFAVPLGLLIGWYRPLAEFLNPVLELFRNTATLALLPVFVLLLGLGETSKVAIILYAAAWPILLNTIAGVRGVDPLLVKSARSMGLRPLALFQKVILPAAVPTIFTGVRLAGAYSILVLVAAEMVGAKAGLGYLINDAQFNFRVHDMYAGIIAISVLGLLFNVFLVSLERRFSTWRTTP
ncbi:NitT/TauT family transport system permease protein [Sinosporangium album]|uniref:NitT/TauT family transport system permease protein n=1 Tax=Sinosporangium album TaxID=504805 RepID=A0A1G8F1W6_9ACTN|nr:ABC transporter permease [Sinosporangium album]SDH76146.1 NitT/TauT family transport system permease protein [Sinosporangium album]